jgi:predicted dehydrogenase
MQKLRGALIGYGFIAGHGHVPAYLQRKNGHNDVEIVAVADICEARRELARKVLPEARIYNDYLSLLDGELGLDFVDIATPPCDHGKIALEALKRGLHVLCEKPLTHSLEEAQALMDQALKSERVIFPCHNYKHAPVVKAINETIQSGRIGKVRSITLNTFRNTHAKGVLEWNTHWRRHTVFSGGGIAMDHGSHSFYLAFDWMGSYPTAVTAKMSNLEPQKYDTEDNFSCALTFPTGVANLNLTWTAGVRKVIYTIQGERGGIMVDDDDMQISVMRPTQGPDIAQGAVTWETERRSISSHWMDASHVNWFNSLFDQFKHAIEKREFVGREARESLLCVQLILAAYRSARTGCQEISLPNH